MPISVGLRLPHSLYNPFATSPKVPNVLRQGTISQRLPVVQDDDLGALAASFNRMQAGLAERQRLHAAFGTYMIPAWRRGYSNRATISSPGSVARSR